MEDYDGSSVINKISDYLANGASILELGMGTGLDLDALSSKYNVLGTDDSPIFIQEYKNKNNGMDVRLLDAVAVDIDKKFDCIFSNKVLQHLTKDDFITSLKNQNHHLNPNGILFFTLWEGEYREELMFDNQLRFTYYTADDIRGICGMDFKIETIEPYTEAEHNDSLLVVLKTNQI